eukprot:2074514-Alexandrium_andersonii.AAC.1
MALLSPRGLGVPDALQSTSPVKRPNMVTLATDGLARASMHPRLPRATHPPLPPSPLPSAHGSNTGPAA